MEERVGQDSNRLPKSRVTIGICVRNCEEYIRDAISSITNQDFPHSLMELIFVDDGSEDATLSIINEFVSNTDFSVKVIHTSWKGLGHARNVVVANTDTDYILWVDGDMVLSKDYVTRLVVYMDAHPDVGVTKGSQTLERGGNFLATLETYSRAVGRLVDFSSRKARSKTLGTGGSIFRTEAIRLAGSFDENLRGYGEDSDIEIRIRGAGWALRTNEAGFLDYERHKLTWRSLWSRYWLRGYYTHYFLHKNEGMLKHYRMFPPAAFLSGFLQANTLFRRMHEKKVFLLPFQNVFKMSAWYVGFINSHANAYQPQR